MLPLIALGVVGVVGGVLGYAATRPNTFRYQRSATIKAPPERVYALIDDFRSWLQWSPWEKLDPALEREFDGPASGVGAKYAWKGNKKVGQGRMEITGAQPPNRLVIRLEFIAPWKAVNTTTFEIDPVDGGSRVNWTMEGDQIFMGKLMGVFMDMEKMIGAQFEEGLENMRRAAEG